MMDNPISKAHLHIIQGRWVEGWVEWGANPPCTLHTHTLQIDIDRRLVIPVDFALTGQAPLPKTRVPFRVPLPRWVFDGHRHSLLARGDSFLAGEPLLFQSKYAGRLDSANHHTVHGWVMDLSRPGTPLSVDIFVDSRKAGQARADGFRDDLKKAGYGDGKHGFTFPWPAALRTNQSRMVEVGISGQAVLITADPSLVMDSTGYLSLTDGMKSGIRHLLNRCEMDGEASLTKLLAGLPPEEARTLLQQLIGGGTLADLRYMERRLPLFDLEPGPRIFPVDSSMPRSVGSRWPVQRPAAQPVDVIVPIYKGREETVRCLRSLIDSPNVTPFEVICVLDNPDDLAMTETVQSLACATTEPAGGRRPIRILDNPENLGFVVSANRGMQVHADRDVILLNSDTVVHGDWLDRLRSAAYSSPEIGTVTPLSNNATVCSYPDFFGNNELPGDCTLGELDRICEEVNPSCVIDIPTGVGFCMYIRRNCIDSIGLFDEKSFGKGYGEENDFCRRAAGRGWRNLLAADTFVQHVGSVSFGREKLELTTANSKSLEAMHPRYHERIAAFAEADPVLSARRRIDAARLRRLAVPKFCFVGHDFGGGTKAYVDQMGQSLITEGLLPLVLRCSKNGRIEVQVLPGCEPAPVRSLPNLLYDSATEFEELVADLARFSIQHFHFQTNINVAEGLYTLPARLGVSYDCTVHDYSWICPRINLVDGTLKYCGEPATGICERCIQLFHANPEWNFDETGAAPVHTLRLNSAAFFRNARRVFCPSHDVKTRMEKYFPDARFAVFPHEDRLIQIPGFVERPATGELLQVAVLGEVSIHKGSQVLRSCIYDAWKRSLPLRFVVIGYTDDDETLAKLPNVVVTGRYSNGDIPELLREYKPTLSFFPAVCPETYSYTLSIALRYGLFPVAFDLGSIAERIRQAAFGYLLPLEAADLPGLINDALLKHAHWMDTHPPARLHDISYSSVLHDYYDLAVSHHP